jgi:hypothetical protein
MTFTDGRSDDAVSHPAPVWKRPQALGYHEELRGLGGIVAPLLSGFSLAAIATIVTGDDMPALAEWSVAALAAAVAFLIFSMQVAFASLSYNSFPAEILTWRPEVTVSEDELQRARAVQASDFDEMTRLGRISFSAYSAGLMAFLLGLLLLLIPDDWSAAWIVAVCVTGAVVVLELWWITANHTGLRHPVERQVKLSHADDWTPELGAIARAAVIDVARQQAASANSGETGSGRAPAAATGLGSGAGRDEADRESQ